MGALTAELKVGFAVVKLGFKRYFDFKGRSSRSEYWWWFLFITVISTITRAIDSGALGADPGGAGELPGLLNSVWGLAVLIPSIAVTVRRLHDTNRSGWWALLALVPLIGIIVLLYWAIKAGDEQSNKYG